MARHSTGHGPKALALALAAALVLAGATLLQNGGPVRMADAAPADAGSGSGDTTDAVSPFAPMRPGQTQAISVDKTPSGLTLGRLQWSPIASRCSFVAAENAEGEREGALAFVTMAGVEQEGRAPLERGYVMANGIVRELEMGKTTERKDGSVVTRWTTSGEPRINVDTLFHPREDTQGGKASADGGSPTYAGELNVYWGDKQAGLAITGTCANGEASAEQAPAEGSDADPS